MLSIRVIEDTPIIKASFAQPQDETPALHAEVQTVTSTSDYNELQNIPRLNGELLMGDVSEIDPTVPSWAKSSNKPEYSADEVGAISENSAITLKELEDMFK